MLLLYAVGCFVVAAFALYGLYTLLARLLLGPLRGNVPRVTRAVYAELGISAAELDEVLVTLRDHSLAEGSPFPVLLVDHPLREEALLELRSLGAEIYLSYEEYDREKRSNTAHHT